jgi:hypothetical protein
MYKLISVSVILLLIIGCNENLTESGENLSATTNTNSYVGITQIIVTLKNETDHVVYFTHCGGIIGKYIECKDSIWTEKGNIAIVCLAILPGGSVPIGSMQTKQDTIIFSNQPGIYRLKYPYSWREDQENQGYLLTNEFNYTNPR